VAHTPPPVDVTDPLDSLKNWVNFGVSEANKVDQSNGRTTDVIDIITRCEQRDADAMK
jgi:hypothetical protein